MQRFFNTIADTIFPITFKRCLVAARAGNFEIVHKYMQANLDNTYILNETDNNGYTILMVVLHSLASDSRVNFVNLAGYLLTIPDLRVNIVGRDGNTALILASFIHQHHTEAMLEIIDRILKKIININDITHRNAANVSAIDTQGRLRDLITNRITEIEDFRRILVAPLSETLSFEDEMLILKNAVLTSDIKSLSALESLLLRQPQEKVSLIINGFTYEAIPHNYDAGLILNLNLLNFTAAHGRTKTFNKLLSLGYASIIENGLLWSLVIAAANGHDEILKVLIAKLDSISELANEIEGQVALGLVLAVIKEHPSAAEILLDSPKIDTLQARTDADESILVIASQKNYMEVVRKIILRAEVDEDNRDEYFAGFQSIEEGLVQRGHQDIVDLFNEHNPTYAMWEPLSNDSDDSDDSDDEEDVRQNNDLRHISHWFDLGSSFPKTYSERLDELEQAGYAIEEIPDAIKDIFTLGVMNFPISLSSGKDYDRVQIQKWFATHPLKCPQTNFDIRREELKNHVSVALDKLTAEFVERQEKNAQEVRDTVTRMLDFVETNPHRATLFGASNATMRLGEAKNSDQEVGVNITRRWSR